MTTLTKFKGKSKATGEWAYGSLVDARKSWEKTCFIYYIDFSKRLNCLSQHRHEVISSSVGQFIGESDKHNNEIYKGDIIKTCYKDDKGYSIGEVVYVPRSCRWGIRAGYRLIEFGKRHRSFEIIGNLTDNPNLIKE